jgi:hypothetical protein
MVEVIAPTLSAMVSRPRIAFNILYSFEGVDSHTKKNQTLSTKATLKQ